MHPSSSKSNKLQRHKLNGKVKVCLCTLTSENIAFDNFKQQNQVLQEIRTNPSCNDSKQRYTQTHVEKEISNKKYQISNVANTLSFSSYISNVFTASKSLIDRGPCRCWSNCCHILSTSVCQIVLSWGRKNVEKKRRMCALLARKKATNFTLKSFDSVHTIKSNKHRIQVMGCHPRQSTLATLAAHASGKNRCGTAIVANSTPAPSCISMAPLILSWPTQPCTIPCFNHRDDSSEIM